MKRSEMTPEQKKRRNQQCAAANHRYDSKTYHKLAIRLKKNGDDGFTLDQVKAFAAARGVSVTQLFINAVREVMNTPDTKS